jgi:hypothetical protein
MIPYVARWDLDKTYLRTEFDTLRDLLRTAFEHPDQKRTVPGASALIREIASMGASIHILSGSPEQLRSRLEEKLRLDGARWDTFTLKPNLRNLLRLRFRATREQLGYKLPALLSARAGMVRERDRSETVPHEVLVGDDAESDALVYSVYADVLSGRISVSELEEILVRARAYDDNIADAVRYARLVDRGEVVDRILIHLDRQSPPSEFVPYGGRVVPFYNYLQAAFVLHEDDKIPPSAVVRVAVELLLNHRFDGRALGRSYLDLYRRGHLRGHRAEAVIEAYLAMARATPLPGRADLDEMCAAIRATIRAGTASTQKPRRPDYLQLLANQRGGGRGR